MPDYEYGELAGDFMRNAASQARQGACDLYSRFPKWAIGSGVAIDSPAWNIAQGIADSVCATSPGYNPPPQPSQPFVGGQCELVAYNVTMRVKVDIGAPTERFITLSDRVWGSVSQYVTFKTKDNQGKNRFECGLICRGSAAFTPTPEPVKRAALSSADEASAATFGIVSVSRVDGQPDNCGNPPKQYPPYASADPPAADLTRTRPVPDSRGNNINIPFAYVDGLLDANFNIRVDVGGVAFNFDAGGVSFNYGNKNSGDGSPGSFSPPDVSAPDIEPKIDDALDKLDDALDKLDEQGRRNDEKDRKPPDDPDYEEDPKPPGDSSEDGVEGLKWLKTTLTKLPISGKTITKSDGQLVAYCGWLEWRVKGRGLPRIQLNYPLCIFPAPEGADGYAVTFTNGAEGTVSVIKAKPAQQ